MHFYNYFRTYDDYFWEWDVSTHNQVSSCIACIKDGKSIVYLEQIIDAVKVLSEDGIPPFGALLLVLIASNNNVTSEDLEQINEIISKKSEQETSPTFHDVFAFLQLIQQLPKEYKTKPKLDVLLQAIFYKSHNRLSGKKAIIIINKYTSEQYSLDDLQKKEKLNNHVLYNDFRALSIIAEKFKNTNDIINAMANVPSIEEDITVFEESLNDEEAEFIQQLINTNQTFEIGSLVKRIWSGLKIPMHNSIPSGQPLGGVSDITNKGDFDRLLISEFANDDTVFLSRLTNSEALYIEREAPPETNKKNYVFLIDVSLKNWGTPKIISYAAAIGIHTHQKATAAHEAYAIGDTFQKIDLNTVSEVIDAKAMVSGSLHFSTGMGQFFEEFKEEGDTEVFLISSEEAIQNNKNQAIVQEYFEDINYTITTNLNGDINFYKHQNKKRKHLQYLNLPYDDLWSKHKRNTPKTAKAVFNNDDLNSEYPLLYPLKKSEAVFLSFVTEMYVLQNNNLYSFTSSNTEKGLQLIYENIPFKGCNNYTIVKNTKNELLLFGHSSEDNMLNLLELNSTAHSTKKILNKRIQNARFFNNANQVYLKGGNIILNVKHDLKTDTEIKTDTLHQKEQIHFDKVSTLRSNLKSNNYNVLSKLEFVDIREKKHLCLNSFALSHGKILKFKDQLHHEHKLNFNTKVNLILKNPGVNKLTVIKVIKGEFNLSLKEAKELVDSQNHEIIAKDIDKNRAGFIKKEIENTGATCYLECTFFESNDGSSIINQGGVLCLTSSNTAIPKFYITSILNKDVAMASATEFAGNSYFLPNKTDLKEISVNDFYEKYINQYIKHVVENEDTDK